MKWIYVVYANGQMIRCDAQRKNAEELRDALKQRPDVTSVAVLDIKDDQPIPEVLLNV